MLFTPYVPPRAEAPAQSKGSRFETHLPSKTFSAACQPHSSTPGMNAKHCDVRHVHTTLEHAVVTYSAHGGIEFAGQGQVHGAPRGIVGHAACNGRLRGQ